jgi:hypothetical protein
VKNKEIQANAWVSVILLSNWDFILFRNQLCIDIVFCTYHLNESALNNNDTNVGRDDEERKRSIKNLREFGCLACKMVQHSHVGVKINKIRCTLWGHITVHPILGVCSSMGSTLGIYITMSINSIVFFFPVCD